MSSYLLNRNGHFHLRIRVPSDLTAHIPAAELVKSLKTQDLKMARVAALPYRQGIHKAFTLLRSGFITPEQARECLDMVLNRKGKTTPATFSQMAPEPACSPLQAASLPISPALPPKQPLLLSAVVKEFLADRQHGWSAKTHTENEGSFVLILDVLGDIEVESIDRLMARSLRDNLLMLPANLYKLFPKQTAKQVLEMLQNTPAPVITPMSITTVNKHIFRFSTLLKHCLTEGYIKDNPAVGLKIKQKKRADEERKAYTIDDQKKLVANLPCKEDKPERYWIPLIGMFSALRLDETCQLHTEDVKEVDGIWCFDINDDGNKKLKTLSSKRIVPIHPQLIELGFLDHVASVKSEGKPRLWMNLQWRKEDGYGNAFGKWFQRYNRKHVTADPLKTFHSLRHSFADSLKQQGVLETVISELVGHANNNITTGRYGKKYKPEILLEAVCKIRGSMD